MISWFEEDFLKNDFGQNLFYMDAYSVFKKKRKLLCKPKHIVFFWTWIDMYE